MKKVLLLLFVFFITCKKNTERIEFKFSNNLPIIEVLVNEIPVKMLIDTGASVSLIDINLSDSLSFSRDYDVQQKLATGISGTEIIYGVKDINTMIGKDTLDIKFKAIDLKKFRIKTGIVGIIGSDYLRENNLIINYKDMTLK